MTDDSFETTEEAYVTLRLNYRRLVELPEGEMDEEWVAYILPILYQQASKLFSIVVQFCTDESCPTMAVEEGRECYWPTSDGQDEALTASEYIEQCLAWFKAMLDNPQLFPGDPAASYPGGYFQVCLLMVRRLLHVYQHIYHAHNAEVAKYGFRLHLNTAYRYLLAFACRFGLVEKTDTDPSAQFLEAWGIKVDDLPTDAGAE
ncbi:Mob1-like protein [Giardia muris]|uniref:Mob1-like protein n=1 Tax=Giardia muris TaxID=5742 RepID=A0A4Z1SWK0_GIAMU|nr:Mob1-like protein [Giardia muris]|eukprot:TNJ30192.1 Mob1-like protein [Giardia muris]